LRKRAARFIGEDTDEDVPRSTSKRSETGLQNHLTYCKVILIRKSRFLKMCYLTWLYILYVYIHLLQVNHRLLPSLVEDRLRMKEVGGRLRRRAARSSRRASTKKVRNVFLAFSWVSSLDYLSKCYCHELLVPNVRTLYDVNIYLQQVNHRLPSLVEDRLRMKEVRGRLRRRAARENHRLPSLVEDRLRLKEVRGRLRRRAARSSRGASAIKVRNFYLAFSCGSSLERHLCKCCCGTLAPTIFFKYAFLRSQVNHRLPSRPLRPLTLFET
jgi:hypothetical protein